MRPKDYIMESTREQWKAEKHKSLAKILHKTHFSQKELMSLILTNSTIEDFIHNIDKHITTQNKRNISYLTARIRPLLATKSDFSMYCYRESTIFDKNNAHFIEITKYTVPLNFDNWWFYLNGQYCYNLAIVVYNVDFSTD